MKMKTGCDINGVCNAKEDDDCSFCSNDKEFFDCEYLSDGDRCKSAEASSMTSYDEWHTINGDTDELRIADGRIIRVILWDYENSVPRHMSCVFIPDVKPGVKGVK